MLQLISSGLAGMWLNLSGVNPQMVSPSQVTSWQGLPWLNPPKPVEAGVNKIVDEYVQALKVAGLDPQKQEIWLRTEGNVLIDRNGTIPVPSASLTKTATSLAALATWGANKRFITSISASGKIAGGVLDGDLIVEGGGDPLFVWEDAIAIAQSLNQLGIKKVSGNLIIVGNFYMNYKSNPQKAGELLKQALTGVNLPSTLLNTEFKDVNIVKLATAPGMSGAKLPQVLIAGQIQVTIAPSSPIISLIKHESLLLSEIIKQMNIYSNNEIAEMLATGVGGAEAVMKIVSKSSKFPISEIQLINGSGLGVENKLSPRAVCQIFRALQQTLQLANLTLPDIFPVAGGESLGTLKDRNLPVGTTIKTGTLNEVSALGGVLPTRDRGLVWFVIVNRGSQIAQLRQQQDRLLHSLLKEWGEVTPTPLAVTKKDDAPAYLGDPKRNSIVLLPSR